MPQPVRSFRESPSKWCFFKLVSGTTWKMKIPLRCVLTILFFAQVSLAQGPAKTTISDNVANLSGGPIVNNSLTIILQQTMTTSDGFVIFQGTRTAVTIPAAGTFSVALPPNLGSVPSGTSYSVSYRTQTDTFRETWIVPQSATPINLLAVRALSPPIPSILIPFPQNIPDPSCIAILASNPNSTPVPVWTGTQWKCGNPNIGAVTMDLENPTSADLGKFQWKPKNSLIITRISCSVDQGTATVNLDIRQESTPNSPGTQMLSTPLTCTTSTGATTLIANPNVPGLSPVALLPLSASGVSILRVHAEYQLSP